jgi:hypothetical protein
MIGDTKIKKAIIATLFTMLMATAAYATISIFLGEQKGTQIVTDAAKGEIKDFSLPTGYVNASGTYTVEYAVNVTTYLPSMQLQIKCFNYDALVANYTRLVLRLREHGNETNLASLDLLSSGTLYYTLASAKTYEFDYYIEYTPKTASTNTILLDVYVVQ